MQQSNLKVCYKQDSCVLAKIYKSSFSDTSLCTTSNKKKIHATNASFLNSLYSLHQHDCPQIAVFITMPAKMQNQKNQKQPPRAGISKSTSKFLPRQKKVVLKSFDNFKEKTSGGVFL